MIHAIIDLEDKKGRITIKGTGCSLEIELGILIDGLMEDENVGRMFVDILSNKIEAKLKEKLNDKDNSGN